MKMMNKIKKYAPRMSAMKAAAGTGLMTLAVSVNAAVPQDVKDSIAGAKDDGLEAGWIVVGVVAALFVIRIVKGRYRDKFGSLNWFRQ